MILQFSRPVGSVGEGTVLVAHLRGKLVLLKSVPRQALEAAQFQATDVAFQLGRCLYEKKVEGRKFLRLAKNVLT